MPRKVELPSSQSCFESDDITVRIDRSAGIRVLDHNTTPSGNFQSAERTDYQTLWVMLGGKRGASKFWILFGSLIPSDVAYFHGFQISQRVGRQQVIDALWNQMSVCKWVSHTLYV